MYPIRQPLALLAGLALLGLAACQGGNTPVGPDRAAPTTVEVNGVHLVTVAPGRALVGAGDFTMVQSKKGATISSGDATLSIEPGSIPDNTKVTMEPLNDGYVEFKFGPSGLQFSPAAVLTISAAKANLDLASKGRLKIAVAHDDQDDWQIVGGTYDPATDTVTVPIEHFSRYALCVD